jgi:competence protein ComEA
MWKQFVREYFIFTRKERTGIIIIVALIFVLILFSSSLPFFIKQKVYSHKQFESEIAALSLKQTDSSKAKSYFKKFDNEFYDNNSPADSKRTEHLKAEVFYFDPNTISAEDWRRLGIREKTITTIQNYLSKGGRFKKPEDISKIWGLFPGDQQRLMPYVSIKKVNGETVRDVTAEPVSSAEKKFLKPYASFPVKSNQAVDVNLADTTAYISLPGIGSRLSQRIIAFREKLGGFYSVNQVGETYLLPDSTFQKIKSRLIIGNIVVKHININVASVDEMKVHPYLRYNIANAIFQYRQQHGNFNSVDEIKKIIPVTAEVFDKVAPYLSIQ